MKNYLLLCGMMLLSLSIFAQQYRDQEAEKRLSGAEMVRYKQSMDFPVMIRLREDAALPNVATAIDYTKKLVNNPNVDFCLKKEEKTAQGEILYRFVETIGGYLVEFSAWNILFQGNVRSLTGEIVTRQVENIEFLLSEEDALQAAFRYVNAEYYMWQDSLAEAQLKIMENSPAATYYPVGEKVIAPDSLSLGGTKLTAAYKFNIYSTKPYNRQMIYVDALTGTILYARPLIHFDNEIGIAHTQYSGIQSINTESTGGHYILYDHTRGNGIHTLNCQGSNTQASAVEFTDNDNIWNNVNAQKDQYATDAHFGTMKTYDYYLNVHDRNSIDGIGHALWSYVHYDDYPSDGFGYDNAFWNGQYMTYGDGSGVRTPFTALDITGHEITHGLTSHTADLYYQGESGALNEAFSDIFGTAIEFYATPALANWTMGERIGVVLRSMQDPNAYGYPNTYHGLYWYSGSGDQGGVHYNSNVLNYWFYLICNGGSGTNDLGNSYQVDPIGMSKAEKIAFRTLTLYLSSFSDYEDVYFCAMQAVADLYGGCSIESQSVGNAFYAIGVSSIPYTGSTTAAFSASQQENCTAPFIVNFQNRSSYGNSFVWNFGDGTTSTLTNPTHTYQNYGQYNVTLTANGGECGVDTTIENNFIIVSEALPCITLIPENGITAVNGCFGFIYDAGGPNGNYPDLSDGRVTINATTGATIALDILEFNIEPGLGSYCNYDRISFYDGPNIYSSKINGTDYCNSTGNPQNIVSTGSSLTIVFHSDQALNFSGFKIAYHCVGNNIAPISDYDADHQVTCSGKVLFSDKSYNNPTTWLWDFGDGTTSTLQNPEHQYLKNGSYPVKLTTTNSYGTHSLLQTHYITVNMPAFDVEDIFLCGPTNFDISIPQLPNTISWYLPDGTSPMHVGNSWNHPPVAESITYYLSESYQGNNYHVGPTNNISGGGYFGNAANIHSLIFDAYTPFTLKSVLVNAQGSGVRHIALRDASNQIIAQRDINIPNGVSRIQLDIEVPQAVNLQLTGLDEPNLYRTSNGSLQYPYVISNVLSINRSTATGAVTDYYYYFYDWEVETPDCQSEIIMVKLSKNCTGITEATTDPSITIYPNPSSGLFSIKGLAPTTTYFATITNISGQILAIFQITEPLINLLDYAPGLYFLKLTTKKNSATYKLIKE